MAKKQEQPVDQGEQVPADGALTTRIINVTIGFRGVITNEAYIYPGVYREDDPNLYGLADFLIESGRAEVV